MILKHKIKKGIALIFAILFSFTAAAHTDSVQVNSNKYSFSFDASNVFNQLFRSQVYSSEIYFSYNISEKNKLRFGTELARASGSKGNAYLQLKLGYSRVFKKKGKWEFYYGGDAIYEYEDNLDSEREINTGGGLVYVGANFYISPHFSLGTEPSLYFVFLRNHRYDTFLPGVSSSNKQGFTNIGLVRVNYHF
jgi:hypothetical protein